MNQELSLQLWSVRDYAEKDFKGTLEEVAKMGYVGVEFAGYGGLDAAEMKQVLEANGLSAVGSHVPQARLENNLDEELEYNAAVGNRYVICPWSDIKTADDAKRLAEFLNVCGETCQRNGFYLGYHNHAHEFVKDGGKYLHEILLEETEPGKVFFELDLYWVTYGGEDAAEYMKKCSGRLPFIHLKQIGEEKKNVVFSEGLLDFKQLIADAKACGAERFVVEHEQYGERTSMECVRLDIEAIKNL